MQSFLIHSDHSLILLLVLWPCPSLCFLQTILTAFLALFHSEIVFILFWFFFVWWFFWNLDSTWYGAILFHRISGRWEIPAQNKERISNPVREVRNCKILVKAACKFCFQFSDSQVNEEPICKWPNNEFSIRLMAGLFP